MFKQIQKIHFVGIGGSGMSGIAEVLITLGYSVSGSDMKQSAVTDRLASLGARICIGHKPENLGDAQVVVTSTAVGPSNPEVRLAQKNKIPVIPRIEMLAELARLKYAVTIAGTHGKTTTTSMTAMVLQAGGLDPTIVVGGRLKHLDTGARLGTGDYLVAEADESDGSFLKLTPTIAVVTNIDSDHLNYYGTMDALEIAFIQHLSRIPFYGCAILCADDGRVRKISRAVRRRVVTYGLHHKADLVAQELRFDQGFSHFKVVRQGRLLGEITLHVPGAHNVLNSLAAVACGLELGLPFEAVARGLGEFQGVGRRLERVAESDGVLILDDYGHHPTEIKATLKAVRQTYPHKRLWVIFQPHRFSRTQELYREFGASFESADFVYLLDIYPAGEKPIRGVSSGLIDRALKKNKVDHAWLLPGKLLKELPARLSANDVIVTLGAGDVWKLGESLKKALGPLSHP